MAFLSIQSLHKAFGAFTAVESLSIDVQQGEFVSLLGPSGCGKSTTLQMIAGFIDPTGGEIRLRSQDLLRVPPNKRDLGIVFQSYALFPHMTVAANVAFGLEMKGVARSERAGRIAEILDLVGLKRFESRFPKQLSGGQQQRVALARALVTRPNLLLLDEPLSNLDAKLREGMQDELRQIQQRFGTTTVLVTHDQAEALALSDRIVVMSDGKVEQIGTPTEVYDRPATPFVANFLGKTNLIATQKGEAPHSVRPERIRFSDAGLNGTVTSRSFLGAAWMLHVETPVGRVLVTQPHDGRHIPEVGAGVHLDWDQTQTPQLASAK